MLIIEIYKLIKMESSIGILEGILTGGGVFQPSRLVGSMKAPKTLTIMVVVGVVCFFAFVFFSLNLRLLNNYC